MKQHPHNRTPIGLRRHMRRHAAVGDLPTPAPGPAVNPPPAVAPPGIVPIFAGWNVWDVWQADNPSFSVMNIGLSLERQLRVWVENQIKDNAPGSDVADPLNPAALRGEQVQPIGHVTGLTIAATRADDPELADAKLNSSGSTATLRTVRFWSRAPGERYKLVTTMPWARDDDYLLNVVYQPTAKSPVTNAPQPGSLAGTASDFAGEAGTVLKVVAVGAAVVLGVVLVASLANARKAAA